MPQKNIDQAHENVTIVVMVALFLVGLVAGCAITIAFYEPFIK